MITKSDFNKICRICLEYKSDKMMELSTEIKSMLQNCTTIQLSDNERLPNQICEDCTNTASKYCVFKKQCEHSEQYLLQLLTDDEDTSTWLENDDIKLEDDEKHRNEEDDEDSNASDGDELIETYDKNKLSKRREQINWMLQLDPHKCDVSQLKCNLCDKVLVHIGSLARHMTRHDVDRQFTRRCEVCDRGFYEEANYLKHVERHQNQTKKHACDKCDKTFFEINSLASHLRKIHHVQPIECEKCGKQFTIQTQLDVHLKKHANEYAHRCAQCGKGYYLLRRLQKHVLTHKKTFYCEPCDKTYANHTSLKNHTDRYHLAAQAKQACQICGKVVLHMKRHMLVHNATRAFKCIECQKSFLYRSDLVAHCKRKHSTAEENEPRKLPYLCNVCGKRRTSKSALDMHILQAHSTEKTKQCHLCDKVYKTGSALHRHIRCAHKDERRFKCAVCSKVFYTNPMLRIHMRTHTGERPYTCVICAKSFVQSSTLKTHMKVHLRGG